MNREKKVFLGAVVAVALLLTGVGMYQVNADNGTPGVLISGGNFSNVFFGTAQPAAEQTFGSSEGDTTVFTAVSTTQDVGVGRNLYVAGQATFAGSSTFSGALSGVPTAAVITMTSATNTPCAVQNTSGVTRTVLDAGILFTGGSNAGATVLIAGTSTAPTVTSTTPLVADSITKVVSRDIISTTSTMRGSSSAYAAWRTSEWFVFNTATSVNSGTCRVLYY